MQNNVYKTRTNNIIELLVKSKVILERERSSHATTLMRYRQGRISVPCQRGTLMLNTKNKLSNTLKIQIATKYKKNILKNT